MVLRNPPLGRNRHHAPEGPTLNPHLKWGLLTEKTVRIDGAIPNVCDFDLSTKDGFLKDLGELEQAVLSARNQMAGGPGNSCSKKQNRRFSSIQSVPRLAVLKIQA